MKTLQVICDNVYGKELIRPACSDSQIFCRLLKQKSFTQSDINQIKSLGYSFELTLGQPKDFKL